MFFEALIFLLSRKYNMDLAFVPHIRYGRNEDGLKSKKKRMTKDGLKGMLYFLIV